MPELARLSLLYWVIAVNAWAVVTMLWDKFAAQQGLRRVPEMHFFIVAILGGWPASFVAQVAFHHKTHKTSFQLKFWGCAAANGLVLLGLRALAP